MHRTGNSVITLKGGNHDQTRKVIDPEALAELVTSIEKFGIIQPLLFRDAGEGCLTIFAGERRWQAAQQVGLATLPAIFVEGNYAELALVENLQRQDLTFVEEAEALQRLMDEQNFTQEQLGGIVGKARTTVRDILTINRLPQALRLKQQKAKESGGQASNKPQGKGLNDPAAVLEFTQKVVKRIGNIDTTAWTSDERENIRIAFVDIKNQIDIFLNPKPIPS